MAKERYVELDLAKGVGILLVILGHIQYISEDFRNFIVAFHIPLFFIIAGMLICIHEEDKKSLAKTVMKKGRSILVPYFIFSLVFIIAQCVAYRIGSSITLELIKQNIFLTVIFYGMSVLWFLGALFAGEVAFLAVVKLCGVKWTSAVLVFWMILSCMANRHLQNLVITYEDRSYTTYFMYLCQLIIRIGIIAFFVGAGFYLWKGRQKLTIPSRAAGLVGIICLVLTVWISRLNGGVDLHFLVFNKEYLYFIGAISGTVGVVALSDALKRFIRFPLLKVLQFYGKNSLIVMMTHVDTYLMYASTIVIMHFNKDITDYQGNVRFCTELFLLVTAVESVVIFVINHWFPWMIGKSRGKK